MECSKCGVSMKLVRVKTEGDPPIVTEAAWKCPNSNCDGERQMI